jgi:hypothetical protein
MHLGDAWARCSDCRAFPRSSVVRNRQPEIPIHLLQSEIPVLIFPMSSMFHVFGTRIAHRSVKMIRRLFAIGYSTITCLFACCAVALIVFATCELWRGIDPYSPLSLRPRFSALLESIGLLTIAVAAFELGQTVLEEEVWREVHTSGPTRVRRFLSRFLIVVIVALAIEATISVFQFAHDDPTHLPHAALIGIAAAVLLAGWGVFIKCNTGAEMLEPEAMAEAKREDEKIFNPEQTKNSAHR